MILTYRNLVAAGLWLLVGAGVHAKEYQVYYLGGQSNMDGYGFVKELPQESAGPVSGVMIFHGNMAADAAPVDGRGVWSELRPGHGVGFSSDGKANKYSDRFGVELTLARRLKEQNPKSNIALIKYSRGGTSIAAEAAGPFGAWEPDFRGGEGDGAGINQYDHFLATLRHAFAVKDIDGDGEEDTLIPAGIVWMQGESDAAYTPEIAQRYEANLKRLMDLVRAALRTDDLPVTIGRISDSGRDESDGKMWDQGETVRAAQAAFCEKDGHAALVTSTDNYGYSDPWHYDSAGYLDLGRKFADALNSLEKK
jgi:iduronate 2-sulfatase